RKNALDQAVLQSQIFGAKLKAKTAADQTKARTTAKGAQVNKYGYTNAEWQAMTSAQRQKIMLDYDKKHHAATTTPKAPKDKKPTTGPGSLTPAAEQKIVTKVNSYLGQMQNPPLWDHGPGKGKARMTAQDVANELKRN